MPREEWGTKRLCPVTGKRFYDLGRDPVVSPYTGEVVPLDTGKGSRTMLADKPDKDAVKKDQVEEDEVVLDDDDDDDDSTDVDLGDDVLEDDDDDDNVSLDDIADVSSDEDDS